MTSARALTARSRLRGAAIIVGLRSEARLARALGLRVYTGGGTAAGAADAARRALADTARALISLGLAGGLDPALRPGEVIVPEAVLTSGRLFQTDPGLGQALGGVTAHRILGGESVVADALSKQRLHGETGAAAVDLESGVVATLAMDHRVPFAALRVICDPAERTLPPAALVALNQRGAIGFARVLGSVLAGPAQLPALLVLARDAALARRALAARIASIASGA